MIGSQNHAHANEREIARQERMVRRRLNNINMAVPIQEASGSPLFSTEVLNAAMRHANNQSRLISRRIADDNAMLRFSDERLNFVASVDIGDMIEMSGEDGMTHEVLDPTADNAFREGVFPLRGDAINPNRVTSITPSSPEVPPDVRAALIAMIDLDPPAPLVNETDRNSRVGQIYEAKRRARMAQMGLARNALMERFARHIASQPVPPYVDHVWYEVLGYPGTPSEARSSGPEDDIEQPPGVLFVEQDDGSYERRISTYAIEDMLARQFIHNRDFSATLSTMTSPMGPMRNTAEMQRISLRYNQRKRDHLEGIASQLALNNSLRIQMYHDERLQKRIEDSAQLQAR